MDVDTDMDSDMIVSAMWGSFKVGVQGFFKVAFKGLMYTLGLGIIKSYLDCLGGLCK